LFVAELPHDDEDEIDELPDVEPPQGEDHEDSCADFSDIEAVDPEGAEKKTEQEREDIVLRTSFHESYF